MPIKDPEARRAYQAEYRQKHKKEKYEYNRAYAEKHKERVTGNVQVISWRANFLKKDATTADLKQLADYMEMFHG